MPSTTTEFVGKPVLCNLTRREDDTDDITVHLTDRSGDVAVDAIVQGWTAQLLISLTKGGAPVAGGTFNGTAVASPSDGNIPIDMSTFALTTANLFYEIRVTDTVTSDSPARIFFEGKFKVTDRIGP